MSTSYHERGWFWGSATWPSAAAVLCRPGHLSGLAWQDVLQSQAPMCAGTRGVDGWQVRFQGGHLQVSACLLRCQALYSQAMTVQLLCSMVTSVPPADGLLCDCSLGVILWEIVTGEAPNRGRMRSVRCAPAHLLVRLLPQCWQVWLPCTAAARCGHQVLTA